jgi:hypothetical protein
MGTRVVRRLLPAVTVSMLLGPVSCGTDRQVLLTENVTFEPPHCAEPQVSVAGLAWRATAPISSDTAAETIRGVFTVYDNDTAVLATDADETIGFRRHSLNSSQECKILE